MYYSKYIIFTLFLLSLSLTRPTNSYGANYDNLPDFYNYKDIVKKLIPSDETIIIHFEPGLSKSQKQAILSQELAGYPNITQADLEFGKDYVLIHLQGATDVDVLTNNLYNNNNIRFSYPVFKDDSTQLVIPTDEVIVKLESGYTITHLQNAIAGFNGVTIDNSVPQRNPQEFVLKITNFASTNCMNLANSLSTDVTTNLMINYACPNFMVQLLPQSVDTDTDCITEEGYAISDKQWALHSDGSYGGISRIVEGAGVDAPKAWDYIDNVLQINPLNKPKIAILDDGIYSGHNALTVSSVLNLWEESSNTTTTSSSGGTVLPYDPNVVGGIKFLGSIQESGDQAIAEPESYNLLSDQEVLTAGGGLTPVNPTTIPSNPFPLKHGTRCAGIIAANPNASGNTNCISGVAYNRCNLIDVRFTKRETGWRKIQMSNCLTIADAITKAAYDKQADIILLPYAFAACENVKDAIEDVSKNGRAGKGTLVVISAGNYGYNHDSCFPANVDDVLAVGWSTQHNERKHPEEGCDLNDDIGLKIKCKGSNRNWKVDLVAPGSDMITTGHQNPNSYPHFFQGTSASASLAAGVAALVLNVYPNATNQELQDILKSTCDKIHKYDYYHGENGGLYTSDPSLDMYKSDDVGYGKINAYNAVIKAARMAGLDSQTSLKQKIWTRIHNQSGDVIEESGGDLDTHTATAFPIAHNTSNQVGVGLRFDRIALPPGAIVTNAFIRFTASGDTDATARNLTIKVEAGDAANYDDTPIGPNELTSRTYITQMTNWQNIPRWIGERKYDTPNLANLIQLVVDHPNWRYSGALSFLFTNVSTNSSAPARNAYAYEMAACKSPQLFIEYLHPNQTGKTDLRTPLVNNAILDNPVLEANFYPIPFDDLLQGTIKFKQANKTKELHIEVYNVYGQLIDRYTQNDPQHQQEITLNTQDWSKGVYFIQVKAGEETYNTKVIK